MEKQLIVFNGGLQTKLSPHLLQDNQAVECVNINLDKGSIYPLNGLTYETSINGEYVYQEDENIISNTDPLDVRDYARFGTRIYWTNGTYNSYGLMRYDGTNTGVEATAPVAPNGVVGLTATGTNESLYGDYTYTYTYVDTDGIESAPTGYYTVSCNNQNVNIVISSETNTPNDLLYRRIYRTGGNNPTYNLVAEITGLTFTDNIRDIDVSRIELATFENNPAPTNLTNLIENNGTMWGSVGDKVYFSINGHPEYWNSLDYLQLNDDCTGIGKFGEQTLVFTRADAYVVTGFNRDTVSMTKLPYREGCMNHRSIANVGDYLVWSSKNGVCVYNGANVQIATRNILSWNELARVGDETFDDFNTVFDSNTGYEIVDGLALQGKYYAVFNNGIGILRIEDFQVASTIEIDGIKSLYYDDINNFIVAVIKTDTGYEAKSIDTDSGNKMTSLWRTGEIQGEEGYGVLKHYRKIQLDNTPIYVKVKAGDKEFTMHGKKDFFLPPSFTGYTIQIEIATNNEIRSLEYQYGVKK